ncbi:MAG TPA: MFS transporter [Candidatus Angelobacter sp.]
MIQATQSKGPFPVRDLLKNSNFCLLWIGSTISLFGAEFSFVAVPWLILQVTGSGAALGTILMVEAAPRAALMLFGGVTSDRFSLRQILLLTTFTQTLVVAGIAALAHFQAIRLWHLYALAFAFGFSDAFAIPARQALLPALVPENQLPAANSLASGSAQITAIAGPAPAGIVLRLWGIAAGFLIDAVCFVFVLLAIVLLREPKEWRAGQLAEPAQGVWRSVLEGFNYVWQHRALRSLIFLSAALNLAVAGPLVIGLAVVAKQRFSSATDFGLMLSFLAIGSLVGALLPALTKKQRHRGWLMLVFSGVLGVGMIAIGLLHHLVLILLVIAALGLGSGLVSVHVQSWFQAHVDRRMLGRVTSVFMVATLGLVPVSYALTGFLAQVNLTVTFVAAGLALLVTAGFAAINQDVRRID